MKTTLQIAVLAALAMAVVNQTKADSVLLATYDATGTVTSGASADVGGRATLTLVNGNQLKIELTSTTTPDQFNSTADLLTGFGFNLPANITLSAGSASATDGFAQVNADNTVSAVTGLSANHGWGGGLADGTAKGWNFGYGIGASGMSGLFSKSFDGTKLGSADYGLLSVPIGGSVANQDGFGSNSPYLLSKVDVTFNLSGNGISDLKADWFTGTDGFFLYGSAPEGTVGTTAPPPQITTVPTPLASVGGGILLAGLLIGNKLGKRETIRI